MAEYELVHEIQNLCRNNQMRDVFFQEITCDDPETYVRGLLKGKDIQISTDPQADGTLIIHTVSDGMMEKFVFTRL